MMIILHLFLLYHERDVLVFFHVKITKNKKINMTQHLTKNMEH